MNSINAAILFEFLESINNMQLPVWKRSARQVPHLAFGAIGNISRAVAWDRTRRHT